jgi:tetratricopeptide (TPR) repeat protein
MHIPLYDEALRDYRTGNLEEAARKLNDVLTSAPAFEDAYEALSVILYNQKNYDTAVPLIKKWIALNPHSVMAHTNLSRCYAAKGMILEAENEQAEARKLTWKEELKAKKMEMPKMDHEAQISRFKQVIELDPADVLGYFSLGNAYMDAGKKREALDTFQKAVEVDPKHSSSYYGFGLALEGLSDFKKARQIYEQGCKIADANGDLMTLKKMESRIRALDTLKEPD